LITVFAILFTYLEIKFKEIPWTKNKNVDKNVDKMDKKRPHAQTLINTPKQMKTVKNNCIYRLK